MINREVRHNFDKMLPESVDPEKLETWEDYVRRMDAQTREAFRIAREEIGKSVLLQKKYYDRTSHLIKYKVGDAVLIRDHRHHESGTKKLSDKYDGPYYVLDVLSDVSFRLERRWSRTESDTSWQNETLSSARKTEPWLGIPTIAHSQ